MNPPLSAQFMNKRLLPPIMYFPPFPYHTVWISDPFVTYNNVDFQKSPSSDFIWRGTKDDLSRLRRSWSATSRPKKARSARQEVASSKSNNDDARWETALSSLNGLS